MTMKFILIIITLVVIISVMIATKDDIEIIKLNAKEASILSESNSSNNEKFNFEYNKKLEYFYQNIYKQAKKGNNACVLLVLWQEQEKMNQILIKELRDNGYECIILPEPNHPDERNIAVKW